MKLYVMIIMIFIMTFSGSLGAFFLKKGMEKNERISILKLLRIPELYAGAFLYVLGACTNIVLLRKMPYTIIYPMTSLTYVWTMFVSAILLKEKVTKNKVLAVIFIVTGICLMNI